MLLERPGEVITREEMQKRLWPADTFGSPNRKLGIRYEVVADTRGYQTSFWLEPLFDRVSSHGPTLRYLIDGGSRSGVRSAAICACSAALSPMWRSFRRAPGAGGGSRLAR
jgi:hypothetical protein